MGARSQRLVVSLGIMLTLAVSSVTAFAAPDPEPRISDPQLAQERLDRISEQAHRIYGQTRSEKALEEFLLANGFVKVEAEQGGESTEAEILNSSPGNVTMGTPQAYFDTVTDVWVYFGTMAWGSYPKWYGDIPMPDCGTACMIGGSDAVALTIEGVDGDTQIDAWKLTTYTYDNVGDTITTASTNEAYGVTFLVDDGAFYSEGMYYNGWNYTLDGYLVEMRLRNVPAEATLKVQHKYYHSFVNGSIDGIDLSVGSDGKVNIDVHITNQSETWPATSLPAYI